MFNDVVVTLVQLFIERSESSAPVSIFILILEGPTHECPSETSCSFCLLGKVANIPNFAQFIHNSTISHLENSNRESGAINMFDIQLAHASTGQRYLTCACSLPVVVSVASAIFALLFGRLQFLCCD